jgi:hypothetical protein
VLKDEDMGRHYATTQTMPICGKAAPLTLAAFALLGAFGAAMTRFLAR